MEMIKSSRRYSKILFRLIQLRSSLHSILERKQQPEGPVVYHFVSETEEARKSLPLYSLCLSASSKIGILHKQRKCHDIIEAVKLSNSMLV